MHAKENAWRIIRFDGPERVLTEPPAYELTYLGCNHEGYQEGGDDCPGMASIPVGSTWVDIWGTGWNKRQAGVMGFPVGNPLSAVADLEHYRWPDADDERICKKIYHLAEVFSEHDERFLTGVHRDTLWEKGYMLVGMEHLMRYFFKEPSFVREILHRIMDFQLDVAQHYARLGVELVKLGDDLGAQNGPLLGPAIVDEFLVPEYERLFRFYKERDVLIWFHCCGNVEDLIDTFLDLGVDILNPVQATANDLTELRSLTNGRMTLHGGISSATVMEGPAERIVDEARRRIHLLGQDGGYFCSPDQALPYPKAHVDAFYGAVAKFGRYPFERHRD